MQPARADTVVGNFGGVLHERDGSTTTFRTENGKFSIRTEGPDGTERDYPVMHTFGIDPLQQYLIELPGGRLQAFDVAWDARPKKEGGERWFHLRPNEKTNPGDVLHWSGVGQNWNLQCAECHSTNVQKRYDSDSNTYSTRWSEINVGCESCHGPGAAHRTWARDPDPSATLKGFSFAIKQAPRIWTMDTKSGIAKRSDTQRSETELNTCAPCHSHRRKIADATHPSSDLLDSHVPSLLEEGLYHADGQIDGEVYVYGSFVQSKMFRAGVSCGECHDPHRPEITGSADVVCAKCHAPERFDSTAHHFHVADSAGASCVGCHMPAKTYMMVDERHDHSFRVPRPDLSVKLGTPNACNNCHARKTAKWADDALGAWLGDRERPTTPAEAIHAGRQLSADAPALLAKLSSDANEPAIARATALSLLRNYPTLLAAKTIEGALDNEEPLIRMAAANASANFVGEISVDRLLASLSDPVRAVRIAAATTLAPLSRGELADDKRKRLNEALTEARRAETLNVDSPHAHVNLGLQALDTGRFEDAENHYRTAIKIGPHFLPSYVNLADLLRTRGRDAEGQVLLQSALERAPDSAEIHHALGLLLVRNGQTEAALKHLKSAADSPDAGPAFSYVYGIALHSEGSADEALGVLRKNHERFSGHAATLLALATIHRDRQELEKAARYAEDLVALDSGNPRLREFLLTLQSAD